MNTKQSNKGTASVLIICNEPSTAPLWGYLIREKKMQAIIETNPDNASQHCQQDNPALIILDLQLSHPKIYEVCHKVRATCENPILLFLPAYDEHLILGYYDLGIDDCVVKPVSPAVFYAKIKAWLRYSKRFPAEVLHEVRVGNVCLDPKRNLLILEDRKEIRLTDLEVRLLSLLMSHPGQIFDADSIVNEVWGLYGEQDVSLIKHVVYRLRRKLKDDPNNPHWIQTWHGKGYSFRSQ
jgi:DNA-binding response OmpR family regulator